MGLCSIIIHYITLWFIVKTVSSRYALIHVSEILLFTKIYVCIYIILIDCLIYWFDWLIDWLIWFDWLIDWFIDWLIDWLIWLIDWLIGWLVGWLVIYFCWYLDWRMNLITSVFFGDTYMIYSMYAYIIGFKTHQHGTFEQYSLVN